MSLELKKLDSGVFLLKLKAGENRFNPPFLKKLHEALDEVERTTGATALITTSEGKFFSNGLDLEWLAQNMNQASSLTSAFERFLARLLVFPIPTIAAINGHAFAGGCMFAMAHDFRVMRNDKGWLCLNEVELHLPLPAGMTELVKSKMTDSLTQRDAILTAKRFTSAEALKLRLIDAVYSESELLPKTIELAIEISPKGEDRAIYGSLKCAMYEKAFLALTSGNTPSSQMHATFTKTLSKL